MILTIFSRLNLGFAPESLDTVAQVDFDILDIAVG